MGTEEFDTDVSYVKIGNCASDPEVLARLQDFNEDDTVIKGLHIDDDPGAGDQIIRYDIEAGTQDGSSYTIPTCGDIYAPLYKDLVIRRVSDVQPCQTTYGSLSPVWDPKGDSCSGCSGLTPELWNVDNEFGYSTDKWSERTSLYFGSHLLTDAIPRTVFTGGVFHYSRTSGSPAKSDIIPMCDKDGNTDFSTLNFFRYTVLSGGAGGDLSILDYDHLPPTTGRAADDVFVCFWFYHRNVTLDFDGFVAGAFPGYGGNCPTAATREKSFSLASGATTVGGTSYVGDTRRYVLSYKTPVNPTVQHVELAIMVDGSRTVYSDNYTVKYTGAPNYCLLGTDSLSSSTFGAVGFRIGQISCKATENFLFYTYNLWEYTGSVSPPSAFVWAAVDAAAGDFTFRHRVLGVINVATGVRTEHTVNDNFLGSYNLSFNENQAAAIGLHKL
jgi:hypothetical protein